jgi:hypothetical protein
MQFQISLAFDHAPQMLQVTHALQSDQALQVLHDFVTERQGGDSSFCFIVPGPPGVCVCV